MENYEARLDMLLSAWRCPVCASPLQMQQGIGAGQLCCLGARVHTFDLSRSGYVHLSPRHSGGGDSKEAVRARTAFLSVGYYEVAARTLCELLCAHVQGPLVVDAGCGEGYYTNQMALCAPDRFLVCGFDLSKDAVDAAAKAAKRSGACARYAVASVFELPMRDGSADAVVNVFAPCAEAEFCRVLRPDGVLILVGAGERHLLGLKKAIYDQTYENTARADLPQNMELCEQKIVRDRICVKGTEHIQQLFSMTPYYWRTSPADKQKLARLDTLESEIEFDFRVYRKK